MSSRAGVNIRETVGRAMALHQAGRLVEAEPLYRLVLGADPRQFEALHFLGLIEAQRGRYEEAQRLMGRSLEINRRVADAHSNYARVLNALKRSEEALLACDRALAIDPRSLAALVSRGIALDRLGRHDQALKNYDQALALKPDHAGALVNRGNALLELERHEEALASHENALAVNPRDVDALAGRGRALGLLNRLDEALANCDRALAINPDHLIARLYRGIALKELRRFDEALASFDQVLAIEPDQAEALVNRGGALVGLNRRAAAIAAYEAALIADPHHRCAFTNLLETTIAACDWGKVAVLKTELPGRLADERSLIVPFTLLSCSTDPSEHLRCAQKFLKLTQPAVIRRPKVIPARRKGRIKVAYLSADFRQHPVASLTAHLYELHDRARFEIIGISWGPDDGSELRCRIAGAFDQFHDVTTNSDLEVGRLLAEIEVDIAVDLMGYTDRCRAGIFARRAAPIQVSYLGFLGTMGADFIDYVIADKIALPWEQQQVYAEKIVHLPDCFVATDDQQAIATTVPIRSDAALPEDAFVFSCFNNSYKIQPYTFDVWMRILRAIDQSVLWLYGPNHEMVKNLQSAAKERGVDPARLIFAGGAPLPDHLARQRLADLFLDTVPYNAGATGIAALWTGVPILTTLGSTFVGRMAASMLHSVGLPELVTNSLAEYETLALRLANDPSQLGAIREKLARKRLTHPLFDTDRFRRHIESAYVTMWKTWQRGEPPQNFRVDAIT